MVRKEWKISIAKRCCYHQASRHVIITSQTNQESREKILIKVHKQLVHFILFLPNLLRWLPRSSSPEVDIDIKYWWKRTWKRMFWMSINLLDIRIFWHQIWYFFFLVSFPKQKKTWFLCRKPQLKDIIKRHLSCILKNYHNKQNQFSPLYSNILTTFPVNKYAEETKSIEKERKQTNLK
jgi:hypothetical protein